MKMTSPTSLISKKVAYCPTLCPSAGAGVHSWLMAEANRCRIAGMTADATECLLTAAITRPPKPASEIQTTVAKAYGSSTWTPSSRPAPCRAHHRPSVPLTRIVFAPDKLKAISNTITHPRNWHHWLWERHRNGRRRKTPFPSWLIYTAPVKKCWPLIRWNRKRRLKWWRSHSRWTAAFLARFATVGVMGWASGICATRWTGFGIRIRAMRTSHPAAVKNH